MPPKPPIAGTKPRARRSVTESASTERERSSGLYHASTVEDRIREWREHGATSAIRPDAASLLSPPRSEIGFAPEDEGPKSSHINMDLNIEEERAKRTAERDSQRREQIRRVRASSTPKKRVVSDEHWKSNRNRRSSAKPNPQPDKPVADYYPGEEESVFTVPPKKSSPRSISQARAEREDRRQRRLEARSRKAETERAHRKEDSTTASTPNAHDDSYHVSSGNIDHEPGSALSSSRRASPYCSRSPSEIENDVSVGQDDGGVRKKSRYAETLGQSPPVYGQEAQPRSKKGSFLNKTKEVLRLADPAPAVSSRLPSIEAWLYDQPDPFLGERTATVQPEPVPSTPPSKKRSVQWKTPETSSIPDPNRIWDSIGSVSERNRSGSCEPGHKTSNVPALPAEEEPSPSSTLKRRDRRAVRPKRHTLAAVPQIFEQSRTDEGRGTPEKSLPPTPEWSEQRVHSGTGAARLSMIASVETLDHQHLTHVEPTAEENCHLKRKLTTHEDMMSVLSRPTSKRGSRRKRSVRKTNHEQSSDGVKEILETMAEDDSKYSRELKTLVDGVIPVLLQCVLSKTDAVAAAGLFTHSASANNDLTFTRPIIDMGVALERLKTLHSRIPLQNVDSLLLWCQTAHKAYSEYLKAWRLGFQDVVINLAPLEGAETENEEVMGQDESGDIVNADGNKVDVAYLMKRPLVHIRKLGRALIDLRHRLPDHPIAGKVADDFNELTAAAKNKHQQEKARLEDEAAAYIDATKCRNIRNLAPLPEVAIDKAKRVRARDCFNLTLYHSSGQRLDCKVELILRDNNHSSPDGGDLLICQIDQSGKWLLFAPVDISLVSARKGEQGCDLVVMIRGRAGIGQEWRELLALTADDPDASAEWATMLGSNPLPPKLTRVPSFVNYDANESGPTTAEAADVTGSTLERVPSIETVDVPLGEPSIIGVTAPSQRDHKNEHRISESASVTDKGQTKLSLGGGLQKKPVPEHWQDKVSAAARKPFAHSLQSSDKSTISDYSAGSSTGFAPSSLAPAYFPHPSAQRVDNNELRRSPHAKRPSNRASSSPSRQDQQTPKADSAETSALKVASSEDRASQPEEKPKPLVAHQQGRSAHAPHARVPSSVPSEDLPNVQKLRDRAHRSSISSTPLTDSIRETWAALSGVGRKAVSQPSTPVMKSDAETRPGSKIQNDLQQPNFRQSLPAPEWRRNFDEDNDNNDEDSEPPPPPPQHKDISAMGPKARRVPILRPSSAQQKIDKQNARLSSSPLRNEYAPSTPSGSDSEEDSSGSGSSSEDDSQTSEDFESELFDLAMPLAPLPDKRFSTGVVFAKAPSVPTSGTRTLAPSDSASQGPYRKVPSSAERPGVATKRAAAMICSWSDNSGSWAPIREDFCSIVISPGLIEAFPMDEAHAGGVPKSQDPLVAFELTPMVPLRKPTGIDISIRSPPTENSQIKTTNNVMFRSHSVVECEQLYHFINWARCNNATYLELERSRPRPQPTVTFSNQQAARPRSWFSFGGGIRRRDSYRVGSVPPSSMGESQATANTVSSAMSALKRLSISSAFSVRRSSVMRRPGLNTNASLYSSSNGTSTNSGTSTPQPSQLGATPGRDGPNVPLTSEAAVNGGGMVHNMKVRLSVRRGRDWVPLGVSRLSVLPAANRHSNTPEISRPGSPGSSVPNAAEGSRRSSAGPGSVAPPQRQYRLPSSGFTPHRLHGDGREKRIVVTAKDRPDKVLIDVTLGESCFEKVAHLGIAMQVWKEDDQVRSRGGVVLGQNAVYMIQFYHQQDCAWVFGLVGSYRYSNVMNGPER